MGPNAKYYGNVPQAHVHTSLLLFHLMYLLRNEVVSVAIVLLLLTVGFLSLLLHRFHVFTACTVFYVQPLDQ